MSRPVQLNLWNQRFLPAFEPLSHGPSTCVRRIKMPPSDQRDPDFLDGQVLRCSSVRGLTLGEIWYPAGCERKMHTHERACFHFLLQGGYREYLERRSSEFETSSLAFQPRGHRHSYRCTGIISRSFTLELDDAWVTSLSEASVSLSDPAKFEGGVFSWFITRLYNEFCVMEGASALVIEALALEMAVEVSRRKENLFPRIKPAWLRQAEDLMRDRFGESLSLRDIARSVGVHPVHLARVFRKFHGCTAGDYLRRVRIDYTCQQLIHSDSTLVEIALAAGFSDQSQFSHTFKRCIGLTPAQFRSTARSR